MVAIESSQSRSERTRESRTGPGTIRSYALPPLNPYAAEYVSHRIERGQMTLEVDYNLKEGEFEADTHVVLRNVRVGEKTGHEFSRRLGTPLESAVAHWLRARRAAGSAIRFPGC